MMSEAILKYNLSNPEELKAVKRAIKSTDMAIALFDISNNLKRHCPKVDAKVTKAIQDILEENNINLDELID